MIVFSNYPRTIPGWLTLFYVSRFGRKTQFKMTATCTNYYAEMVFFHQKTMQIEKYMDSYV